MCKNNAQTVDEMLIQLSELQHTSLSHTVVYETVLHDHKQRSTPQMLSRMQPLTIDNRVPRVSSSHAQNAIVTVNAIPAVLACSPMSVSDQPYTCLIGCDILTAMRYVLTPLSGTERMTAAQRKARVEGTSNAVASRTVNSSSTWLTG